MMLRNAKIGDAQLVATIHHLARAAAMPWLPSLHTQLETESYFANHVLTDQHVRIAENDHVPVGFSACQDGWLNHLYIHPNHWRRVVGSALLADAKIGKSSLKLCTFQRNQTARTFYKLAGFEEVERTNGSDNEERMPDVCLEWHSGIVT